MSQTLLESATSPSAGPPTEISKLTKVQKLAALLIILGPDSAGQLIKNLEPPEIEAVSSEMAKFTLISQELQAEILKEFSGVALQASTSLQGGVEYTRQTLEKGLGMFKASDILGRVAPTRTPVAAMQTIVDMEPRQIYNLLRHEQPQTIALVLSFVPTDKAGQVFGQLPTEQRDKVLERLATMVPTPIEVVERVVEVLQTRMGVRQTRALNQTGGVKNAADVLNAMEKAQGKSLLMALEERNPELCQAIRNKMFTFEDLANVEPSILQRILREVDLRDLAVSLKTASDKLKTVLLGCISKRAAETVQEEITYMGPVRLRDIELAQLRIIDVVRKLETEGDIDLGSRRSQQYEVA